MLTLIHASPMDGWIQLFRPAVWSPAPALFKEPRSVSETLPTLETLRSVCLIHLLLWTNPRLHKSAVQLAVRSTVTGKRHFRRFRFISKRSYTNDFSCLTTPQSVLPQYSALPKYRESRTEPISWIHFGKCGQHLMVIGTMER